MSWLDFIGNIGTNIKEGLGGVANKVKYANAPTLPVLQMADNGGIDLQKSFELSMAQPKSLKDNILGRTFTINSEAQNPETGELEVSQVSKFQPGLLNDIRSGAKENFATGFAAPNWEQNITPDGRKKGLGYRFGEGLGSFARFAESPLGRGLIMAGIVGASGGSGLEALGYGAGAGLGNQQARMKDTVYRQQLKDLGMSEDEVNSIKGYVTGDVYKNVADTYKARWNKTSWGDLANFNPKIAEVIKQNPQLATAFVPASVANTILKGDLTDAQIANLLAQANLAGVKGKATMINANANKMRAESTKAVNDFILGNETPGTAGFVQMQAPDGKIYKVPTSKIQEMQNEGGKIIG